MTKLKMQRHNDDDRLGSRLAEISRATACRYRRCGRRVKAGEIRVARIGGMPIIPRVELIRLGLIDAEDRS